MEAVSGFPVMYNLSKKELYKKIISDVKAGQAGNIHPEAYKAYTENFRKAVGGVFSKNEKYADLQAQFNANVSRFAAYKAYLLTEQLKQYYAEKPDNFDNAGTIIINTFNRYQAAEYNTAVARARTAKQWLDFTSDPTSNMLYPNLKWLPSRSATRREEHVAFYGLVLPKTDEFWQRNQPGNLWNCKCDWEETDNEPSSYRPKDIYSQGLEGNPAETGEIFTDKCSYVRHLPKEVAATFAIRTEREIFRANHKDDKKVFETGIGKILYDGITVKEISKGAKTDKSYFYKQEIAQHFDKYVEKLVFIGDEDIDLTHNNHNNIYYRRKSQFLKMKKYKLEMHDFMFQVKLGLFEDGTMNLYCITEQ